MTTTVVVTNLKGGTSKTTSAAFIAHALTERGRSVLVVDADPQGSALRWSEDADWTIPVIRLDSPKLHRTLPGVAGDRYDAIVIDTPPNDEGIVGAALRVATHVVIPMAPTPAEYERLPNVGELIESVAPFRNDDPVTAVLLTRAIANAASTRAYRELVRDDGFHVLRTEVRRLERFSQSMGAPVDRANASAYGDAVDELLTLAPQEVSR